MRTEVDRFVALVRAYVRLVERSASLTPAAFLRRCATLLPRLYASGQELPDVDLEEEDIEAPAVASPEPALARLLGEHDLYRGTFDPCDLEDDEVVTGALSDDLGDVYLDLVRPLHVFDQGRADQAVWEWRFNLHGHAGDHLVDALRVIHRLLRDRLPPEPPADGVDD